MRTPVRSPRTGPQDRFRSPSLWKLRAGEAVPSRIQSAVDGARWAGERPAKAGPRRRGQATPEGGNAPNDINAAANFVAIVRLARWGEVTPRMAPDCARVARPVAANPRGG